MVVPYKLFYRLGFHPWEDLAEHPPFAEKQGLPARRGSSPGRCGRPLEARPPVGGFHNASIERSWRLTAGAGTAETC